MINESFGNLKFKIRLTEQGQEETNNFLKKDSLQAFSKFKFFSFSLKAIMQSILGQNLETREQELSFSY